MATSAAGSSALPVLDATAYRTSSAIEHEVVELFDQMRDRLLRYLLSSGLPVADGEEVIQETFLALFRHLNQGKPRHNLPAWLFRVAHNLAMKRHLQFRRDFPNLADLPGEPETRISDPAPNAEVRYLRAQVEQRLRSVVEALAEQDRRCLILRAEGLRYREIAQVLDMSLGSVSISLTRSLARLARVAEKCS